MRGGDIHQEGLRGKSVRKKGQIKVEKIEKGGAEGHEEREFALCIRPSLIVIATNGHHGESD